MEGTSSMATDQEQSREEFCTYRVPERMRQENARAYTPRIVSIGPLHHDKAELKAMEEQKLLYLKSFLQRTNVSLEDYVTFVKEREQKVRNHYAESLENVSSNKLVQMILVDAAFIVELLWKNHWEEAVEQSDRIFHRPWIIVHIRHDLMLLENQLPFFILEDIFELAKLRIFQENSNARNSLCSEKDSLIRLTHKFFQFKAYLGGIDQDILRRLQSSKIKHFVDFYRKCHIPRGLQRGEIQTLTLPSVTELYEAGVDLRLSFCYGDNEEDNVAWSSFTSNPWMSDDDIEDS